MAGGQERILRRRIRVVQSTRKITKAMELIAASQIVASLSAHHRQPPLPGRDGPDRARGRPGRPGGAAQLLGAARGPDVEVAVVLIVGDRGLSGPYNSLGAAGRASAWWPSTERRDAEVRLFTRRARRRPPTSASGASTSSELHRLRPTGRPSPTPSAVAAELWRPSSPARSSRSCSVSTRYRSAGSQSRRGAASCCPCADARGARRPSQPSRSGYTEFEPDVETLLVDCSMPGRSSARSSRRCSRPRPSEHQPAARHGRRHRERRRARPDPDAGS